MINEDEDDYQYLKSLLKKKVVQTNTFHWLRQLEDVFDMDVFRQYDAVLILNSPELKRNKPRLNQNTALRELKSRFISMASHEFRTPLTSIVSSAELIEAYIARQEYDKANQHVARIRHAVHNLNDLLTELLSVDNLEEGKTKVHFQELHLPALVADVLEKVDQQLKPGQVILCEHTGQETVVLDPDLTKIVLLNLVSNAAKYSPPNSTIQISIQVSPEKILFQVSDNGIGIPPEDQHHLFDRFFRARNVTNIQGTGLGLYLSKNYVEMMHGNLWYSSEFDKGSTFYVAFNR
jgi:signal transduction histidine kinase